MTKIHLVTDEAAKRKGVTFWCPGCNSYHLVWTEAPDNYVWVFDGNMDAPTITPSLLMSGEYGDPPVTPENFEQYKANPWPQTTVKKVCHTVVTKGVIFFCPDSTHALSGKSVPMQEF